MDDVVDETNIYGDTDKRHYYIFVLDDDHHHIKNAFKIHSLIIGIIHLFFKMGYLKKGLLTCFFNSVNLFDYLIH